MTSQKKIPAQPVTSLSSSPVVETNTSKDYSPDKTMIKPLCLSPEVTTVVEPIKTSNEEACRSKSVDSMSSTLSVNNQRFLKLGHAKPGDTASDWIE
jgi:hypothetical protein